MIAHIRYSVTRRSRGHVMLCAVYTEYKDVRSAGFLVDPQN
jgi:hypothetical protein